MNKRGFTLIEVVVVMGIIGVFLSLVNSSVFGGIARVTRGVTAQGVVTDLRQQQMRAMMGATDTGGGYVDFSVRFEPTRYILFPGLVYTEGNPNNTIVNLDPSLTFSSVTLPDSLVAFARGSGEVRNFSSGQNTVTVSHTNEGSETTITINALGVVNYE